MTAGADAFASGLFTRFDLTLLVVEPTLRSLAVYRQYLAYAADHGVAVKVMGNKIEDDRDMAFMAEHVGDDLIAALSPVGLCARAGKGPNPTLFGIGERELRGSRHLAGGHRKP
jgi:CO dehydrogenase maturation factor